MKPRWSAGLAVLLGCRAALAADVPPAAAPLPDLLPARESSKSLDDPKTDGWSTEVFTNAANAQLKALAKMLEHPEMRDAAHAAPLLHPAFSCGPLRPGSLVPVVDAGGIVVTRPGGAGTAKVHEGAAGLVKALAELMAPFDGARELRSKFKLWKVERGSGEVTTRQFLGLYGLRDGEAREANASWICRWTDEAGAPPRLKSISIEDHEEATTPAPLFTDVTGAAIGGDPAFRDQLSSGIERWWGAAEAALGVDPNGYQGLAVGDVDGDGRDDLYVCQSGGLPNRLFVQEAGTGAARDRAHEAGVDFLDRTRGALIVDLDNDGDQDLVLAMARGVAFLANDGAARFTLRAEVPEASDAFSLAAADYDADGDVDVYACRYYPDAATAGPIPLAIPYHDATNGAPNFLLRNDIEGGEWTFRDVTRDVGLDVNNTRFSFSASWEDYDDDGDPDLYVANDFGRKSLYRNDGGRFVDVAAAAGVEDIAAGMGVTWGDPNGDGRMDIHVSNMFSSAGNRITFQGQFKERADAEVRGMYQRHARGDSLFLARGDGTFEDVSVEAGITMGRWAWGSLFCDIDSDGLEDLVVANGYISNTELDDL